MLKRQPDHNSQLRDDSQKNLSGFLQSSSHGKARNRSSNVGIHLPTHREKAPPKGFGRAGFNYPQERKEVRDKVEEILVENEDARNSDVVLMFKLWEEYDCINIKVPLRELKEVTKPATIQRVRREVQNDEGRLLPTAPGVLKKRKVREADIRDFYGDNSTVWKKYKEYAYEVE